MPIRVNIVSMMLVGPEFTGKRVLRKLAPRSVCMAGLRSVHFLAVDFLSPEKEGASFPAPSSRVALSGLVFPQETLVPKKRLVEPAHWLRQKSEWLENIPQRLEPHSLWGSYGTTKVVPFQGVAPVHVFSQAPKSILYIQRLAARPKAYPFKTRLSPRADGARIVSRVRQMSPCRAASLSRISGAS